MTLSVPFAPAAFGFALALLAFVALLARLGWKRARDSSKALLGLALSASCVWASAGLGYSIVRSTTLWSVWRWADLARSAAWIGLLLALLLPDQRSGPPRLRRAVVTALLALVVLGAAYPGMPIGLQASGGLADRIGLLASLALAVIGLVCVEQLARNVPDNRRWSVKPLVFGLGGAFAFDLYLYTDGVLFGRLDAISWSAHGAVLACAAPLLGMAMARSRRSTPLSMSHQLVFHSTALLGVACYLLGVGSIGWLVRIVGGSWGASIQLVVFAGALMVLGVLLTSGTLRSKLRVLVTKHLLKYRYDYREEWLRLTRLVSTRDSGPDVYDRCAMALADLVESPAGAVWLKREGGFRQVGSWNAPGVAEVEPVDGELVQFLGRKRWIVDLDEYKSDPGRYNGLRLPAWLAASASAWLVVPLAAREELTGFVVLMTPRVALEVDWEVHDLLKAAGAQVGALLGQIDANAALSEAERFASFSRKSAFVVHDLKNIASQLSLLLKNAERYREDPEFQHDMLETIQHVVDRIGRMLQRSRAGTTPADEATLIDLAGVVRRVCEAKRDQRPRLECSADEPIFAMGHEDRLEHVLVHCLQNAIEATVPDDDVSVSLCAEGGRAVIEVADSGVGMSSDFVRQRLFKPFQTTKRTGMGIGAYETQQYVTSLGGQVQVESALGAGTTLRIVLPLAHSAQAASLDPERVA